MKVAMPHHKKKKRMKIRILEKMVVAWDGGLE
jgi:hypothetical protein